MTVVAELAPHGVLRAAINLGNPVLAQGTAERPAGVTVELAGEIAARVALPVRFTCVQAARDAFAALTSGAVDVAFLAVEPARASEVAFTGPYALIEGLYAVPRASALATAADVDRPGVRVGVKHGSAYDLFLSRTLRHATVVRGDDGVTAFRAQDLEVAAGIRQPLAAYAAAHPDVRLLNGAFQEIRQAVATGRDHGPDTRRFLHDLVEELKATGFVAAALRRSGVEVTVAPPTPWTAPADG